MKAFPNHLKSSVFFFFIKLSSLFFSTPDFPGVECILRTSPSSPPGQVAPPPQPASQMDWLSYKYMCVYIYIYIYIFIYIFIKI